MQQQPIMQQQAPIQVLQQQQQPQQQLQQQPQQQQQQVLVQQQQQHQQVGTPAGPPLSPATEGLTQHDPYNQLPQEGQSSGQPPAMPALMSPEIDLALKSPPGLLSPNTLSPTMSGLSSNDARGLRQPAPMSLGVSPGMPALQTPNMGSLTSPLQAPLQLPVSPTQSGFNGSTPGNNPPHLLSPSTQPRSPPQSPTNAATHFMTSTPTQQTLSPSHVPLPLPLALQPKQQPALPAAAVQIGSGGGAPTSPTLSPTSAGRAPSTGPASQDGSPKSRRPRSFPSKGGRKLFVGQLPKTMTDEELTVIMQKNGALEDLHIIYDRNTGRGTGAAFVVFKEPASALMAVEKLHGRLQLPGMHTCMQVRLAEGEVDADKDVKLFVGQVPPHMEDIELRTVFQPMGQLLEVAILKKDGKSRGCAFVRFGSRDSAMLAIQQLDGKVTLPCGQSPMTVRFANTEAEKRKKRDDKKPGDAAPGAAGAPAPMAVSPSQVPAAAIPMQRQMQLPVGAMAVTGFQGNTVFPQNSSFPTSPVGGYSPAPMQLQQGVMQTLPQLSSPVSSPQQSPTFANYSQTQLQLQQLQQQQQQQQLQQQLLQQQQQQLQQQGMYIVNQAPLSPINSDSGSPGMRYPTVSA